MKYEFAPLEGVTTQVMREAHSAVFPTPDTYFTPFLALTQNRSFSRKERFELAHTRLGNARVVPQVLTNSVENFLWAANELAQRGFEEVNVNMGCPSGTVYTKGKGSGMLRDEAALRTFLDGIFTRVPLRVSVKTRLGIFAAEEFEDILSVLLDYPISEIIVHARVRSALYNGMPDEDAFARACAQAGRALTYNGDLFSRQAAQSFCRRFPNVTALMIGRGALANPAIFGELRGEGALNRESIEAYLARLAEGYCAQMGPGNAAEHLKGIWTYLIGAFECDKKAYKRLNKARGMQEYNDAVHAILEGAPLAQNAGYKRPGYLERESI